MIKTELGQTYDKRTDKSLKTEGPKILSNDFFYFRTVIFGGPIPQRCLHRPSTVVRQDLAEGSTSEDAKPWNQRENAT